jgi:hypothetical protein
MKGSNMSDDLSPAAQLQAQAAEELAERTGGTDVYVPVVNSNYTPEGIVRLEGYVPPLNGGILSDQYIIGHKVALEDDPLNKLESGPHEDNAWVDPNEKDEEEGTPEAFSPTESDTSQDAEAENPDRTSPQNQTEPDQSNSGGVGLL